MKKCFSTGQLLCDDNLPISSISDKSRQKSTRNKSITVWRTIYSVKYKSRINQEITKLKIWLHHPPISCVTNPGETIAHKCCFELFPASRLDFCSTTEFWLIYKRSWRSLKLFLFNLFLVSCLKLETDETRISFSHWHSHSRQCPRRKP